MEIGIVRPIDIESEMKGAYLDYAMSVITARALPDVRDGLKPVQRRILYAMFDMGLRFDRPYKKSARVVGECFVAGTLVLTDTGLRPIEQIERGDIVYTQSGVAPVTELYEMPARDLLKITLDSGVSVTVTPAQPLKVLNRTLGYEWKLAQDLTPDDQIVVRASYPNDLPYGTLPTWQGRAIPLDENIAYLIGQFLSDGWFEQNPHRFCFYSTSERVIERVRQTLVVTFGYDPQIENVRYCAVNSDGVEYNQSAYQIRINSSALNQYLSTTFGINASHKAPTKRVPLAFFRSPKPVLAALLSGLIDGDGSIHTDRNLIHYGTVSPGLADDVQLILQHLGVFTRRFQTDAVTEPGRLINGRPIQGRERFYALEASGRYAQVLGRLLSLAHDVKRDRVQTILASELKVTKYDRIPYAAEVVFGELAERHLGGGWYADAEGHKFRMGIKYPTGTKIRYAADLRDSYLGRTQIVDWEIGAKLTRMGSSLTPFFDNMLAHDIHFVKVARVEAAPAQKTYDLQVAGEHEFVANGIVSHNCLGKYHPHGDSAVYDAMVRLAQDFSMRYRLVDGQGNFGSVDGDPPAAMRYTEARLARISEEMIADINKNTVDFYPNFDDTLTQPTVLPANLPNLLVNGASGIAVGMATNIPPHNLNEIADACMYMIDRWDALDDISVDDLMKFVHGPDFPTGATVMGIEGIRNAYATGRGRIIMRAKAHIEDAKGNRQRIVVTELPYQVNKATLVERIADLVRNKKIDTISDLRDESDRRGMSVVIELKRGANPKTTLNQLLKHTQLQGTFGVNMLALVDGEPRVLPLKRALELWVEHRREVIRRRTEYDLERARARAHILEGLRIALEHLDEVIQIIRQSQTRDTAKTNLIKRFKFSEMQAQAILDMQLGRLAALERKKIEDEYREVIKLIGYLEDLLANPRKILLLIKEDLKALKEKYGDARRTRIMAEEGENFSDEDLIPDQEVIITVTERGYIKRVPADTYRPQRRGGRGIMGMTTRDEDLVLQMSVANTHDSVLFFTDRGRVFQIKAHLLPEADRTAKGMPLVNFISIDKGENVTALLPVKNNNGARYLVMATKNGKIKRTELAEFEAVRPSGIIALTLEEGDSLNWVKPTDGAQDILIISANGQALRFPETEVRAMGRTAAGVNAMRLDDKDQIVCMVIARPTTELLIVTRNGFAKRTPLDEYPAKGRATGGVRTIDVNKLDETGPIVTALIAHPDDEVAIMSRDGVVIRTEVKQIKQAGRATRGSRTMTLKKGDFVATVTNLTPRLPMEGQEETRRQGDKAGTQTAGAARPTADGGPPTTKKTTDDGPPTTKKTVDGGPPTTKKTDDDGPTTTEKSKTVTTVSGQRSAVSGRAKAPDTDAILAKPSVTEQTRSIKDPKKAKAAEQEALGILLNDEGPTPKDAQPKPSAGKTTKASSTESGQRSAVSGQPAGKGVNAVKLGKQPASPPASKPTPPAKPPTKPKK